MKHTEEPAVSWPPLQAPSTLLRHLWKPGPASGRQFFEEVIEDTLRAPCARCAHTMDDHGASYGPLPALRRDQCLACPCPGFRHAGQVAA